MSDAEKIEPDPAPPKVDGEDKPKIATPAFPAAGERCTPTLQRFLSRHFDIFDFFFFSVMLATRADKARKVALEALAHGREEEYAEQLAEHEANPSPAKKKLNGFARLQSENICIRTVDNFLSFVSEIIQEVMVRKPELLRSEEMVRLDEVLRFKKYADLIAYLVDKKINELSYGGIRGVEVFVRKRTGLELFANAEEKTLLMLAIELRNIYSHNRGIVSDTTVNRLAGLDHGIKLEHGKTARLNYEEVVRLCDNLISIARRLDGLFSKKFKIRRSKYRPRPT